MGKNSKYSKSQIADTLRLHNKERAEVGVGAIQWSDKLASYAQEWADYLAQTEQFKHRDNSQYGENISWSMGHSDPASQAVKGWASEKTKWQPGPVSIHNEAGHYTQMIWHNSSHVGCGIATQADGSTVVVCNYDPRGNWLDQDPVG